MVGANNGAMIRIMLFRYWGEASSAAATVTVAEVMRDVGSQFSALSHLNEDNVGPRGDRTRRIEVLRNELVSVDQTERKAAVGMWDVEVNGMHVTKKEHIEWRDSVTAEPISGGFYMLFIGRFALNEEYRLESKLVFYDN